MDPLKVSFFWGGGSGPGEWQAASHCLVVVTAESWDSVCKPDNGTGGGLFLPSPVFCAPAEL